MAAEAPPSLGAICALLCSANSKRENEIAEYLMSDDNEIYLNSVCSRLANVPLLLDSYSGGGFGVEITSPRKAWKKFSSPRQQQGAPHCIEKHFSLLSSPRQMRARQEAEAKSIFFLLSSTTENNTKCLIRK